MSIIDHPFKNRLEFDVPDEPTDYYRCLDHKLSARWPGMTAIRVRLLQATAISLLIGALTFSLDGNFMFAVGAIVTVNMVLLADVAAVAQVELSSGGLTVTMQDDDQDDQS